MAYTSMRIDREGGLARMHRMDAPVVAAVHTICAAGMAGLAADADSIVAEPLTRTVAACAGIGSRAKALTAFGEKRNPQFQGG